MQTFQNDFIYFPKGEPNSQRRNWCEFQNCDILLAIHLFPLESKQVFLRCFGVNTTVRTFVSNNQDTRISQSVQSFLRLNCSDQYLLDS
jgi:hypothetical protein